MKRIYYFAFESIFDPVMDSQVLYFLKEINNKAKGKDLSVSLVIFNSINDLFRKGYNKKRKEIKDLLNNKVYFFIKFPYLYKFPRLFRCAIFINILFSLLFTILVLRFKRDEKVVFHCRTEIASFILLKIRESFFKNAKIICDCRGIGSKEILYKYPGKKGNLLSKKISEIETYAQKKSDYIFCVSSTFKDYISKNIHDKNLSFKVVPCCIDVERFRFVPSERRRKRQELGIKDKFAVLYSGSLNEWQLPNEMIKIFLIIKKAIPGSIFVIFTKDDKLAKKIILKAGLKEDSFIVRRIPFKNVGEFLQVGDIGLLIREDNDVNRVAYPIKFSEYVRSGVPVLSSITSDVGKLIEEFNFGFNLKDYKDIKEVENVIMKIKSQIKQIKDDRSKNKISGIMRKIMGWEAYVDSIINVYSNL